MMGKCPGNIKWQEWVERFDRMQDRYLIARHERFETIVRIIRAIWPAPRRILDLGCGTGSLSEVILEAFPECTLIGVDLDQSLLALAKSRLSRFGQRVNLICDDLRKDH
jgi:methylase of polypeptide subunit release factors